MTRRERLERIVRGEAADRAAVKLWGAGTEPPRISPAYLPVWEAALRSTDIFTSACSPFDLHFGAARDEIVRVERVPTASTDWVEEVMTVRTPRGSLRSLYQASTRGYPGYRKEKLAKEPEDLRRYLAIPYEPIAFDPTPYLEADRAVGDAGIVSYALDHAMYGVQRLTGSQNLALWSVDCPELLREAMAELARRIRQQVERVLESGLRPLFSWVGPELCIPPLMSLHDFDRFVAPFDTPLVELIHSAGCRVWMHCHGRMRRVLDRFLRMGIDVLNPVEPPPMGDLTLPEAFAMVGQHMALEGNIETHDIMTASEDVLVAKIRDALDAGRGHRHILCPSSGYAETPEPTPRHIRNLLLFVDEAVSSAESQKRHRV